MRKVCWSPSSWCYVSLWIPGGRCRREQSWRMKRKPWWRNSRMPVLFAAAAGEYRKTIQKLMRSWKTRRRETQNYLIRRSANNSVIFLFFLFLKSRYNCCDMQEHKEWRGKVPLSLYTHTHASTCTLTNYCCFYVLHQTHFQEIGCGKSTSMDLFARDKMDLCSHFWLKSRQHQPVYVQNVKTFIFRHLFSLVI